LESADVEKYSGSSTDEYREIEMRFYGNGSVEAGRYSGNISFLLYTSDTVAYGVKIDADVTQTGHGGVVEHIIKTLQANYVLIHSGLHGGDSSCGRHFDWAANQASNSIE
jgi:hypothetical protein